MSSVNDGHMELIFKNRFQDFSSSAYGEASATEFTVELNYSSDEKKTSAKGTSKGS